MVSPALVARLGLKPERLDKPLRFALGDRRPAVFTQVVRRVPIMCEGVQMFQDFLVGNILYDVILGLNWLVQHRVEWRFSADWIRAYVAGRWHTFPIRQASHPPVIDSSQPSEAEQAYEIMAEQVSDMSPEQAKLLLRQTPRRQKASQRTDSRTKGAVWGLGMSSTHTEGPSQDGGRLVASKAKKGYSPPPIPVPIDEVSPWPTAKLDYTQFDKWEASGVQQMPFEVMAVVKEYRLLFPDGLPAGIPPKRPFDHRILLVEGELPNTDGTQG